MPVLRDPGLEAEAAHHRFGEAALDGIVVDDENGGRHAGRLAFRSSRPRAGTVSKGDRRAQGGGLFRFEAQDRPRA
ncbi:hypothetical protein GCM10008965_12650 [Methylorubrum aminovorans]|nr:hypothetical protein GCM10025880_58680 [Methylorubrum aminovorans]